VRVLEKEKKVKKSKIGSRNRGRTLFVSKITVIALLTLIQIAFLYMVYGIMDSYIIYWRTGAIVLSYVVVLYLVNKQENPAYKLAWTVLVLMFPLVGGMLYVVLAGNRTRIEFVKKANENNREGIGYLPDDTEVQKEINRLSKSASVQSTYISKTAGYPVYKNTVVKYFPLGEDNYESLKTELLQAEHFIFMEYFIIKQGEMWDTILDILAQKAAEGVEVRLLYDDFGCAMGVPGRFN
jgi:cardiolipin synthase